MRTGWLLGFLLALTLMVVPVWASEGMEPAGSPSRGGGSSLADDEILWTLEVDRIEGGVVYYKLFRSPYHTPVDVFDTAELSPLQLPMHTYDGIDLHRIVTVAVDGLGVDIHWKVTRENVDRPQVLERLAESSWANSGVRLDGEIGRGEWADATRLDMRCEGNLPVTMYVKNDEHTLYLGIADWNDGGEGEKGSQIGIYFDDNHDGGWPAQPCPGGEGNFWFGSPGSLMGATTMFRAWTEGPNDCDVVEPAEGVQAVVSWEAGHAEWEAQVDLRDSSLEASPGQTVGLYLWVLDWESMLFDGEWPCALEVAGTWADPANYGDLVLAREPVEEIVSEPGAFLLLGSGLIGLAGYATMHVRKE